MSGRRAWKKSYRKRHRSQSRFSLKKVLIVILILAVLAGLGFLGFKFIEKKHPELLQRFMPVEESQEAVETLPPETEAPFEFSGKPKMKSMERTTDGKLIIRWKRLKGATSYKIYRGSDKNNMEEIASVGAKKLRYTDETGEAFATYYYKVAALHEETGKDLVVSKKSKAISGRVRKPVERTAYVGDSQMLALHQNGTVEDSGTERVIARDGIRSTDFMNSYKKDELLQFNADRMYICFGINAILDARGAAPSESTLQDFGSIIDECLVQNVHMEVVIVPVLPVSSRSHAKLDVIQAYNKELKNLYKQYAKKYPDTEIKFLDLTDKLAGSDGYMDSSYDSGDGINCNTEGTERIYKAMNKFVKSYED